MTHDSLLARGLPNHAVGEIPVRDDNGKESRKRDGRRGGRRGEEAQCESLNSSVCCTDLSCRAGDAENARTENEGNTKYGTIGL